MSTSTVYDDVVANVYEEDLQDKEDPDIEQEELEDTEDPDPSDLKPLNHPSTAPTVPIVKHRAQPKKRRHPDSTVAKEMSADEKVWLYDDRLNIISVTRIWATMSSFTRRSQGIRKVGLMHPGS